MKISQTDTADVKTFTELGWNIMPFNIPYLMEELHGVSLEELYQVEVEEQLSGDINIVPATSGKNIDMVTHRKLLDESLTKYNGIWRTLAEK